MSPMSTIAIENKRVVIFGSQVVDRPRMFLAQPFLASWKSDEAGIVPLGSRGRGKYRCAKGCSQGNLR